jgi:CelD/BcsL family acetyltransferase involved in cellulose biosynthesis
MATAQQWVENATTATAIAASCHRGGVEVLERWADDWAELCDDAADDQPFYRPEWIAAHIQSFTPKAKIALITVVADGRLQLILPLLEEWAWFNGVPVRRLRAPVNGHSCRFDAVRRRGAEGERAIEHAWTCLKSLRSWDLLEFESVPAEGTVSALTEAARHDGFLTGKVTMSPNPYIRIPADPAALGELPVNKKLRSQLRGIRRELGETTGLRLRRVRDADRDVLRRFYALEAAGWKGAAGTAIASSASCVRFYDQIASWAESLGLLDLYLLERKHQLLAGHFGLTYNGRYFSPKIAYEESCGKWAPGHLIVEEIVRDCAERGVREYDITGQNDDWKRKWTDQTRGQSLHFIFRQGIWGVLAHAMRFKVRPLVKRALDSITASSIPNSALR